MQVIGWDESQPPLHVVGAYHGTICDTHVLGNSIVLLLEIAIIGWVHPFIFPLPDPHHFLLQIKHHGVDLNAVDRIDWSTADLLFSMWL